MITIEKWLAEVRNRASEDTVLVLVGNKIDKEEERVVAREYALKLKARRT